MTAIDLFAGAGGFTAGAGLAGLPVAWAANHWRPAVDCHAANHPEVTHACQDLHQADWTAVPRHDVLLASPACQGHSPARGKDRPHHDACRATAWAVVSCAEVHRPARIVVENVPAFRRWVLFPVWLDALRRLGYAITEALADAADAGVPQHRERLFVCGFLGASAAPDLVLPRRDHVAAGSVVSFSGADGWSRVQGLCPATRARWHEGHRAHGERFLLAYYGSARGGRSLERPLGTVTTVDRYALVCGDRLRMLSVEEYRRTMGFPAGYVLPANRRDATKLLGNAVPPPLAADVIRAVIEA